LSSNKELQKCINLGWQDKIKMHCGKCGNDYPDNDEYHYWNGYSWSAKCPKCGSIEYQRDDKPIPKHEADWWDQEGNPRWL
jgi:predicted nucleic-acid-binding Zn-ribbon protein